MDRSGDVSGGSVWATSELQFTVLAVRFGSTISDIFITLHLGPDCLELTATGQQVFVIRANVSVILIVKYEVGPRECLVEPLRSVENRNMWLDTFLMNQPSKCLGIAISAITDEAFWIYTKLLFNTINHIQSGIDFRLSDRRCCFNINNHSIIQVHQIVGGIGKDRIGLLCSSKSVLPDQPARAPLVSRALQRRKRQSSRVSKYSSVARVTRSGRPI